MKRLIAVSVSLFDCLHGLCAVARRLEPIVMNLHIDAAPDKDEMTELQGLAMAGRALADVLEEATLAQDDDAFTKITAEQVKLIKDAIFKNMSTEARQAASELLAQLETEISSQGEADA